MLACSQDAYAYTHRLFAVHAGGTPQLLSLPDYDATGWFANDQASMAELDAGAGVLTTFRKGATQGSCGTERSEERRVGKECRARGWPNQWKKRRGEETRV